MSARVVLAPLLLALLTSGAGCAQLREELRNNFRMMGPLPSYKFATRIPVFHEERLPNGLTLIVHEAPYLPLCAVRLELRAGADFRSYFHSFNPEAGDRYPLTGATDQQLAGWLAVALRR